MEEIESGGELMVPGGWTFLGEERLWAFVWPEGNAVFNKQKRNNL